MKSWLTLFLACLCLTSTARNATFEKLSEVNKCWRDQKNAAEYLPASHPAMNEYAWIQLHLRLVEQTLRSRNMNGLSAQQASNRLKCLDDLSSYWHAGNFPVNKSYAYRTPIFIDAQDNFCAVGYLVKASGYEQVSRKIAANTNLAYVKDMNYTELSSWATDHGFTIDELAWIQPAYAPTQYAASIGKGVDGEVKDLYADNANGKLYVGGSFLNADSTLLVNNIAYVTEAAGVHTWHAMGSGVNGPVHAIEKHGGKIYVAGDFSLADGIPVANVACWDGTSWTPVGCTYGLIRDLAVMNGELYAAGTFDVCAALSDVSLARWDGAMWQQMPGLSGKVNTLYASDTTLIVGGAFSYHGTELNAIRWSPATWFRPFTGSIANEVTDFELYKDTLYAVSRRTSVSDTVNLMLRLKNDQWLPLAANYHLSYFVPNNGELAFNALCVNGDQLMLGGSFYFRPMIGTFASNCINISAPAGMSGNWFIVDSAINKMVIFKNSLIAGGRFKTGPGLRANMLNGIARSASFPASVPTLSRALSLECYPNPVREGSHITIRNNFGAGSFVVRDAIGRRLAVGTLAPQASQQVTLPTLSGGLYFLEVSNTSGDRLSKSFVVQ